MRRKRESSIAAKAYVDVISKGMSYSTPQPPKFTSERVHDETHQF
jgi:hypothetical protein